MATILPPAETTFVDANGVPLAGGTVTFYVPGTTSPKDTYLDANQTMLNSNPVILDGSGRAIIFGSGSYRQIVADASGNIIWDRVTAEASSTVLTNGGTSAGTANAQTLSSGTFDGSDGSTIRFVAGLTNTGAMTLSVGGSPPIPVYINGSGGPVQLSAGDISSGNVYQVTYSSTLAAFQLLQSTPPTIVIATEAQAAAGTDNSALMTPLRTKQAINEGNGFDLPDDTVGNTASFGNSSKLLATTEFVRQQIKQYDIVHNFVPDAMNATTTYSTFADATVNNFNNVSLMKLSFSCQVSTGSFPSGSKIRIINVTENRTAFEYTMSGASALQELFVTGYDLAAANGSGVRYVAQMVTSSGSAAIILRGLELISYV